MKSLQMRTFLFAAAVLLAVPSFAHPLFDVDFGASAKRVDSDGKGAFHGVLPANVNENFAGWSTGRATSEIREEGGRRFLRIRTQPGDAGGQFVIGGFKPVFPGVFRLKMTARTSGGRPLTSGLRLNGAPYTGFSGHTLASSDWKEQTWLFPVERACTGSVGFYFYTSAGDTDIARIVLEPATEAELAADIPRPAKTVAEYVRHNRFPLGLPAGWNLGRDSLDAVCSADSREPAPDGVPVLKVASGTPWELWGEAFQTAYPGEPHALRFRYRSEVPAQVAIVDERGHWAGCRNLPASADWREECVGFKPRLLAHSFGLRFSAKQGVFRLDQVSVRPDRKAEEPVPSCSVALAVDGGDIADDTRIQFTDEEPCLRVCAFGLPADAIVRVRVADLYGRERELTTFSAGTLAKGRPVRFANHVFDDRPVGQFRVTAWAERGCAKISAEEELVVTRLPRPVAWGRDAPDSPFGCHFNPTRGVVKAMKAGGVNWVRLHDAGNQVSGWYAQEPERGKWNFHDAEVACYRDNHVKIFAQLGTAPAWATHYGDLGYRHMGYFEKYLRPTNALDWVNYVTRYVKHHERNIDSYFVWNEPWGRWWESAADIRWYDRSRTGEDFAELQKLAYDAVKKVNSAITVSGFNSTSGDTGRKWSEAVEKGGGFASCDVIDWHYYTPNPRGLREDADITASPLEPIRSRHPGLNGKPYVMSEGQGTSSGSSGVSCRMSGLFKSSVPWPAESVGTYTRMADMTCRYILSLLAEGNAKVYLYSSHAYEGLAKMPSFLVLLGADGFPHPALVAHARLAQAVEGRRFVRREPFGAAGVRYVFEGRGATVSAYSELSRDEVLDLAARQPLTDLYGNPVTPETCLVGTVVYGR